MNTFSAGDNALFEHVLRQIRKEHDRSASPITPTPFPVRAGSVTLAEM